MEPWMEPCSWFRKSQVAPGTVISLTSPTRSSWRIISKRNEKEVQMSEEAVQRGSRPFFAAAKLLCQNERDSRKQALTRIYQQIPWTGTEVEPVHYDDDGLVPGGYLTYLVWEIVPGVRLGDSLDVSPFWELLREQRDAARTAFVSGYSQMMTLGYYPMFAGPRNLVWNGETKTLYFIGFLEWKLEKTEYKWDMTFLPEYDLAKAPDYKWERVWNGDTSGWGF
ncbi:hypothetical protein ASPZODRAFT_28242 [Penicilliopsis zonata CBS 506.65]|uniref:Aminoglycoside phosphotransferase domain-containing protein n=1 Tax=Penicilliopsis zonata CBS 506.65 TaxID=1073090 RepID=A0A1L9S8V1_9EURO|nr:hypothetical protein ASPZODRAFT_28242 [Penicilliopsis zonata CBS 506.65]OJJ43587.1 hypothetical protein ASPZODRAFT_28242 [Penicilliopsis zonata CBS 506.65]